VLRVGRSRTSPHLTAPCVTDRNYLRRFTTYSLAIITMGRRGVSPVHRITIAAHLGEHVNVLAEQDGGKLVPGTLIAELVGFVNAMSVNQPQLHQMMGRLHGIEPPMT
jgi:hypothetical protein